jgi:RNA polymerase sigma-70 factor (ECF subfamily)
MSSTTNVDVREVEQAFEPYRSELTAYAYRMLGSAFEAEDAVQEALVRAWRGYENFEGRSALRSWLYRITGNVCFDMLKSRQRRAMPMDLMDPGKGAGPIDPPVAESTWITPTPSDRVLVDGDDPAEAAVARESIRLAFVAALQHLPARQRAVLILREVLKWKASEVAELLDTTVVSVNSALQRARATLAERNVTVSDTPASIDPDQQELLARYVDAFERFDVEGLVSLLHEDATLSMPPFPFWLRGAGEYADFLRGPGSACEDSKVVPVDVNGQPGFAQWKRSGPDTYDAWAIHVLDISDGRIAELHFFVEQRLFPLFGLPITIPADFAA